MDEPTLKDPLYEHPLTAQVHYTSTAITKTNKINSKVTDDVRATAGGAAGCPDGRTQPPKRGKESSQHSNASHFQTVSSSSLAAVSEVEAVGAFQPGPRLTLPLSHIPDSVREDNFRRLQVPTRGEKRKLLVEERNSGSVRGDGAGEGCEGFALQGGQGVQAPPAPRQGPAPAQRQSPRRPRSPHPKSLTAKEPCECEQAWSGVSPSSTALSARIASTDSKRTFGPSQHAVQPVNALLYALSLLFRFESFACRVHASKMPSKCFNILLLSSCCPKGIKAFSVFAGSRTVKGEK